ncbi:MAG: histidine--tRNA ligase [Chloroflexi bacterium]|nr:histidine--tRNA ligase [Chloroflexota bacterium]MCL5110172.1 histidine--tRNA ligase [Chloroflexota bacterium]
MPQKITPQVLRGMRDFLPERMILRRYVMDQLRSIFERFGFEPLETPAIEYAETLEGKFGEEGDKLLYRFEDRGGRRVALRYDLTVPLARLVAMHGELVRPWKRYHMAPVWRAEKPQKGRYREFWQCDVDTVGTESMLADAEAVNVVYVALRQLGFDRFVVKINNRKILAALARYAGVPAQGAAGVYRAIDRLEKVGREAVVAELEGEGLSPDIVSRLLDLLSETGNDAATLQRSRERLVADVEGQRGVTELEQLLSYLDAAGVPVEYRRIDLSMVRGMDYYTGPIFETAVEEPKIGSVSGGGRYDKLVGLFSKEDIPATGVSFGLERMIDVIEELAMRPANVRRTVAEALVTVFNPTLVGESIRLSSELRSAEINVEMYLGEERLGNQIRYAVRKGIPLAVIVGPDELARNEVVLRDLSAESQRSIPRTELASALREALSRP